MKNHCLIVDDNELVRNATVSLLNSLAQCTVHCCGSGEEALGVFEGNPDAFACVITDLNMPGIDGLELGRRLHALSPGVKLVLMTGNTGSLNGVDTDKLGFHRVLEKPFGIELFREALSFLALAQGGGAPLFEKSRKIIREAA